MGLAVIVGAGEIVGSSVGAGDIVGYLDFLEDPAFPALPLTGLGIGVIDGAGDTVGLKVGAGDTDGAADTVGAVVGWGVIVGVVECFTKKVAPLVRKGLYPWRG